MSRTARIQSATGTYHIMLRGVNRQQIFFDEEDYLLFTEILERYKSVSGYELYAYCLMGNHVHLLLKEGKESIGTVFRRIGASFAYWYNAKYERVGHVFQDRFKSEPVEDQRYLLTALRYILRNPVEAGLCSSPEDYPYSSAAEYMGFAEGITDKNLIYSLKHPEDLTDYILQENEDQCLDITTSVHRAVTDSFAAEMILRAFGTLHPEVGSKKNRMSFSKSVKDLYRSGISIRQMSRLTGISRGILKRCIE